MQHYVKHTVFIYLFIIVSPNIYRKLNAGIQEQLRNWSATGSSPPPS